MGPRLCPCRVASFELEEFEAAKAAFEETARLDPKHRQAATWVQKCDAALEGAHQAGINRAEPERRHTQLRTAVSLLVKTHQGD